MAEKEQLEAIVEDLIDVLQLQAKELGKLIAQVEQVTTRLPAANKQANRYRETCSFHMVVYCGHSLKATRRHGLP